MKDDFKVGDRVRISGAVGAISAYADEKLGVGQTGVIHRAYPDGIAYEVLMDNGHVSEPEDPSWPFFRGELELIQ